MRSRALLLCAAVALVACEAGEDESSAPPPAPLPNDPLADIKDPHTLSQLLQWSLAHQDLDELHAKAEAIRQGGGADDTADEPPVDISALGQRTSLPAPTANGAAAAERAAVRPLTPERKAELDALASQMMPDMVALMRAALAKAIDVSLDDESREEALLELQDLVEDIDNARDLKTIGGFTEVVALLAVEIPTVQAAAAWVLGSAVKNDLELQLHVLSTSALNSLLRLVRSHGVEEVRAKALYALSALLRNCRAAQALFGAADGVGALLAVMAEGRSPRLVRKALVIVADLLREHRLGQSSAPAAKGKPASAATVSAAGDVAADDTKASMQFMLTRKMQARLAALGYSSDEIRQLDAESAATILRASSSEAEADDEGAEEGEGGADGGADGLAESSVASLAIWRNASELCDAVVECMHMVADVDSQEKAVLALEEIVQAGLLASGAQSAAGCSIEAVRGALRAYAERCERALAAARPATGSGDDDDESEGRRRASVGACDELMPTARALEATLAAGK